MPDRALSSFLHASFPCLESSIGKQRLPSVLYLGYAALLKEAPCVGDQLHFCTLLGQDALENVFQPVVWN